MRFVSRATWTSGEPRVVIVTAEVRDDLLLARYVFAFAHRLLHISTSSPRWRGGLSLYHGLGRGLNVRKHHARSHVDGPGAGKDREGDADPDELAGTVANDHRRAGDVVAVRFAHHDLLAVHEVVDRGRVERDLRERQDADRPGRRTPRPGPPAAGWRASPPPPRRRRATGRCGRDAERRDGRRSRASRRGRAPATARRCRTSTSPRSRRGPTGDRQPDARGPSPAWARSGTSSPARASS